MKIKLLFITFFISFFTLNASVLNDSIVVKKDTLNLWNHSNKLRLIFTQNSFVNWSAGGNNSIAGILKINIARNYKSNHTTWYNELKAYYGLNKEEKRELRKTEDLFEVNSTFGYRKNLSSNWYNSAKFNFKTQFANGYKYPNNEKAISSVFAPAYLFLGVGTEYTNKESKFKLYLSPLTNKTTFVFNQRLADEGAFGVSKAIYDTNNQLITKSKKVKIELGMLASGEWKTEVMKNIAMKNKLVLYSDYLNNYGNIDIDWEVNFDLTINKYVTANIGTHFIFDNDIKQKKDINNDGTLEIAGAKLQTKQLLGVGLLYSF